MPKVATNKPSVSIHRISLCRNYSPSQFPDSNLPDLTPRGTIYIALKASALKSSMWRTAIFCHHAHAQTQ
jgi:hypothetical protein